MITHWVDHALVMDHPFHPFGSHDDILGRKATTRASEVPSWESVPSDPQSSGPTQGCLVSRDCETRQMDLYVIHGSQERVLRLQIFHVFSSSVLRQRFRAGRGQRPLVPPLAHGDSGRALLVPHQHW